MSIFLIYSLNIPHFTHVTSMVLSASSCRKTYILSQSPIQYLFLSKISCNLILCLTLRRQGVTISFLGQSNVDIFTFIYAFDFGIFNNPLPGINILCALIIVVNRLILTFPINALSLISNTFHSELTMLSYVYGAAKMSPPLII